MLETTEMVALRRSVRISSVDRVRNEDTRQQMGLQDDIINDIERRSLC